MLHNVVVLKGYKSYFAGYNESKNNRRYGKRNLYDILLDIAYFPTIQVSL